MTHDGKLAHAELTHCELCRLWGPLEPALQQYRQGHHLGELSHHRLPSLCQLQDPSAAAEAALALVCPGSAMNSLLNSQQKPSRSSCIIYGRASPCIDLACLA